MAQKLTIQFKAKGSGALKKTLNDLHEANLRLVRAQGKYANANKRVQMEQNKTQRGMLDLQRTTRQTEGSFSVLRSKLLLASFAMALAIKPMLRLTAAAGDKVEIMSKANVVFGDNAEIVGIWATQLGNSIGRAQSTLMEMASTLQDTFVPLGFTRDSATQLSTALTELAIDVASFNNKLDADVVRDFQSAIVGNHETVRKYGIVITEAALKQEAYILGISDGNSELAAAEKVQARLSLIQKGSTDAFGDAERTADSYANVMKRLGEVWKENAEQVGEFLKPLIKMFALLLSSKRAVTILGVALSGLAGYFIIVRTSALLASVSLKNFKKALARTGIGLAAVALGYLVERFVLAKDEMDAAGDEIDDVKQQIADLTSEIELSTQATERQTTSVEDSIHALAMQFIQLGHNSTAAEYSREINRSLTVEERNLITMIDEKTAALAEEERVTKLINQTAGKNLEVQKRRILANIEAIKALRESIKLEVYHALGVNSQTVGIEKLNAALDSGTALFGDNNKALNEAIQLYADGFIAIEELIKQLEALNNATPVWIEQMQAVMTAIAPIFEMISEMFSQQIENIREHINEINEFADAEIAIIRSVAQETIAQEKKTRRWQRMTAKQQADYEEKIMKEVAAQEATINAQREKDKEIAIQKGNRLLRKQFRVEQGMKIAQAVMNTSEGYTKALAQGGFLLGIPMSTVVAALGAIQIAMIAAQKPPTMAQGGLVGGRLHSQGGTMIEAERGEFVMSRNAVDSIGVETMNRINQGGGGGSININFSGNVLSQDYIEDEAIPQIKEALRRGGDLGRS